MLGNFILLFLLIISFMCILMYFITKEMSKYTTYRIPKTTLVNLKDQLDLIIKDIGDKEIYSIDVTSKKDIVIWIKKEGN